MKKSLLLMLLLLSYQNLFATQEELKFEKQIEVQSEESKSEDPGVVGKKKPPLPRFIIFPNIYYDSEPSEGGKYKVNFSDHRFWYILFISTWSPKCAQLLQLFKENYMQLKKRDIEVLGLYYGAHIEIGFEIKICRVYEHRV